MQLQRICNHPDLIQIRETASSYTCQSLQYNTPSLLLTALQKDQWKVGVCVSEREREKERNSCYVLVMSDGELWTGQWAVFFVVFFVIFIYSVSYYYCCN